MLLFAGLGNPGEKYEKTRHNVGFMIVDSLYDMLGWDTLYQFDPWSYDKFLESEVSYGRVGSTRKIILLKPMTFMNDSGRSVSKSLRHFKLDPTSDLIIAHDDLDISLGNYKIQRAKSPRAHNGVDSVHLQLKTNDFLRVRIGIDNRSRDNKIPGLDYVLQKMSQEELQILKESLADAVRDLRVLLEI